MSRSTTMNKWRGKEVGEDEDDQLFAMPLYMFPSDDIVIGGRITQY